MPLLAGGLGDPDDVYAPLNETVNETSSGGHLVSPRFITPQEFDRDGHLPQWAAQLDGSAPSGNGLTNTTATAFRVLI